MRTVRDLKMVLLALVTHVGPPTDAPTISMRILILDEGEIAALHPNGVSITKLDGTPVQRDPLTIEWDAEAAEKGCPVSKVLNAKITMNAKLE